MLINKAHVKEFALKLESDRHPTFPGLARLRVSHKFFEMCEAHLNTFIRNQIYNRSNGAGPKTI